MLFASDYAAEGLHNGGHPNMDTAWRHVKTENFGHNTANCWALAKAVL